MFKVQTYKKRHFDMFIMSIGFKAEQHSKERRCFSLISLLRCVASPTWQPPSIVHLVCGLTRLVPKDKCEKVFVNFCYRLFDFYFSVGFGWHKEGVKWLFNTCQPLLMINCLCFYTLTIHWIRYPDTECSSSCISTLTSFL